VPRPLDRGTSISPRFFTTSTAARSRGHHAWTIGLGLVLLVALAIPILCIWAAIDAT